MGELLLVLDPRRRRNRFWLRANVKRIDFSDDRNNEITFEQIIEAALRYVETKLHELKRAIHEKELFTHPIDHWYSLADRRV